MALEKIEGQPRAVELLRRALAGGRLAHAYAFVGPAGSGRMTTALAFAQALLCPAGGCGTCRVCESAAARQHPDLHLILPTPPEKNPRGPRAIRIDAVRELERQAALMPARASRKVFVIDEAERLTGETPQALLKTLEEPPDRTVIILILPGVRTLPATVLSRCQIVRFQPRLGAETADRREAVEALAEVQAKGVDALFRRAQAFDRDRERAEHFVDGCWLHLRDLLLAQGGAPARLLGDPDRAAMLEREAAAWTMDELLQGLAVCRDAREALAVNVGPRLTLEIVLARLALRAA